MIPVEIITTVISTLAGFIIGFINNKINHKKDIQKQLLINVYAPLKYIFDTSQFSKKYIDTIKMDILNIVKSNNQFVSEELSIYISRFLKCKDIHELANSENTKAFIIHVYKTFYFFQSKLGYDESNIVNKTIIQKIIDFYFPFSLTFSFVSILICIFYFVFKFSKLWLYISFVVYLSTIFIGIIILYLRNKEIKKKLLR